MQAALHLLRYDLSNSFYCGVEHCFFQVDSGGVNLPHQDSVFADRDHFGRIFYNQAQMSSLSIPQVFTVKLTAAGCF